MKQEQLDIWKNFHEKSEQEQLEFLFDLLDEVTSAREESLVIHLHRQKAFSEKAFGPGERNAGILDHIRKELLEIEKDPGDVTEWIDLVILAFDGAWRNGFSPEEIAMALFEKQAKNEARTWPNWRIAEPGKAIEHVR